MSDTKKRLMQFFKNQGFKLNAVVKNISVSEKYFSSKSAVNSDVLEKIAANYPNLNLDWAVSGRGEMLYREPEIESDWKEKYYQLLDMKITVVIPDNEQLKKNSDVAIVRHNDELTIAAEEEIEIKKVKKYLIGPDRKEDNF